jgi:4-hydroxybenzoate polyprenyltransferase
VKTLAVRYGEKAASIVATIFFLAAVALTPIPVIYGVVSLWFIPFVLVTDIGLIFCSISILKNPTRENARKVKKLVLMFFIFGLLAFIFGVPTN